MTLYAHQLWRCVIVTFLIFNSNMVNKNWGCGNCFSERETTQNSSKYHICPKKCFQNETDVLQISLYSYFLFFTTK